MSYTKPKIISIKDHPEYSEKWVQNIIADDPGVLGLGDLLLRDKERPQPRAGRLDLLLQDLETSKRYEVEIQLGSTDESHIIRTLEYWDIERKRYPQYDHCAVIIAEDITSRFLNVISLFNGSIPIVAIQMRALIVGESTTLVFSKVLDEITFGMVDEDEEIQQVTDRPYWENKGSKETMKMADKVFGIVKEINPDLEMKYNKYYIGISRNGTASNFILMKPRKSVLIIEFRLDKDDTVFAEFEEAGLDISNASRQGSYVVRLVKGQVEEHRELLAKYCQIAHDRMIL